MSNIHDCRPFFFLILVGRQLSILDFLTSPLEMEDMSIEPYQSVVTILMYAMVFTRLNISQVMGILSRYMSNPGRAHWDAVKRVFRYFHST